MADLTKEQATARIKELIALCKSGKATDADKSELAALKEAYPKRSGGHRGKGKGKGIKPGNDFSFWNKYPELMENVAKVAWNRIPGVATKFNTVSPESIKMDPSSVIGVDYTPTYGLNYGGKGALTLQFRNIWLEMHRKYRGLGAYEYCDLAIAMLAVIDVFALVASYERLYGVINNYPVRNRAYPDLILKAMHASPSLVGSVRNNLPQFRYSLNRIILQAQRICLPKGFTYLENRIIMNSFIYSDSQDQRASSIIFTQESYAKYVDNVQLTAYPASYLSEIPDPIRTSGTYNELINKLQALVDVLVSNTDVARMCSDLLACYGEAGLQRMAPLSEDWKVSSTYDEHMLFKFHNCQFIGKDDPGSLARVTELPSAMMDAFVAAGNLEKPVVTQYEGNLVTITEIASSIVTTAHDDPNYPGFKSWDGSGVNQTTHTPLDTWKENPSIEDVCEGSLWKFNSHVATQGGLVFDSCGTEVITGLCAMRYDATADFYAEFFFRSTYETESEIADIFEAFSTITSFDWHPYIRTLDADSGATIGFVGDFDNVTFALDDVTVSQIHDAALLSSFDISLKSDGSENV